MTIQRNKKAVKWLKEFLEINFNFKVKIEIDFDTEAVTPFYVVSKNKIILPYKFMLLKSSNNILDHEIFNFFLFHGDCKIVCVKMNDSLNLFL